MPFSGISDLRTSELYKRSKVLRGMSEEQLKRFVAAFNSAFERALRNGASQDEAESTAIAIGYGAARNTPRKKASLESSVHYFAPFMPEMIAPSAGQDGLRGQENSFEYVRQNLDLINILMKDAEFNLEHNHDAPLGRIAGLLLPDQLPEEIRASVDKDAPFVVAASYYDDVPGEIKEITGISAEWRDFQLPDGRFEVLPSTFAVTRTPLNSQITGIKKVASIELGMTEEDYKIAADISAKSKNDLPDSAFAYIEPGGKKDETGKTVPRSLRHLPIHDEAHVRNALARLSQTSISDEAKRTAFKKIRAAAKRFGVEVSDDLVEKYASLDSKSANIYKQGTTENELGLDMADEVLSVKMLESLKNELSETNKKLASLESDRKHAELKLVSLETALNEKETEINKIKTESKHREAVEWATSESKAGKFATDAIPKFASLYEKDEVSAKEIAGSLKPVVVPEATPSAAYQSPFADSKHETALKEAIEKTLKELA